MIFAEFLFSFFFFAELPIPERRKVKFPASEYIMRSKACKSVGFVSKFCKSEVYFLWILGFGGGDKAGEQVESGNGGYLGCGRKKGTDALEKDSADGETKHLVQSTFHSWVDCFRMTEL